MNTPTACASHDPAVLRTLLLDLCHALQPWHAAGRWHGGLRLDNLMRQLDGRLVLPPVATERQLTGEASQLAPDGIAPGYAAFEQYTDDPAWPCGPWTDLYAIGAIAYTWLHGAPPPAAPARVLNDTLRPLAFDAPADLPRTWLNALDRCLSFDIASRPASLEMFLGEAQLEAPLASVAVATVAAPSAGSASVVAVAPPATSVDDDLAALDRALPALQDDAPAAARAEREPVAVPAAPLPGTPPTAAPAPTPPAAALAARAALASAASVGAARPADGHPVSPSAPNTTPAPTSAPTPAPAAAPVAVTPAPAVPVAPAAPPPAPLPTATPFTPEPPAQPVVPPAAPPARPAPEAVTAAAGVATAATAATPRPAAEPAAPAASAPPTTNRVAAEATHHTAATAALAGHAPETAAATKPADADTPPARPASRWVETNGPVDQPQETEAPARARPPWLIMGLSGLCLVIAGWLLLMDDRPSDDAPVQAAAPNTESATTPANTTPPTPPAPTAATPETAIAAGSHTPTAERDGAPATGTEAAGAEGGSSGWTLPWDLAAANVPDLNDTATLPGTPLAPNGRPPATASTTPPATTPPREVTPSSNDAAPALAAATDLPEPPAPTPDAEATPAAPPPAEAALADNLATATAEPPPASGPVTVRLQILPWAEVSINGQVRGVSPPLKQLSLAPGRYTVTLRNGDLPPHQRQIQVEAGQPLVISHQFQ